MKVLTQNVGENGAVLTCYIQDQSPEMPQNKTRKAILIFPGGGYRICSSDEGEPVALAYLEKGFNAFVLNYSVNPNLKDEEAKGLVDKALSDAVAAMRYLKANCEKLEIEADHITALGFSAGGNLALLLSVFSAEKPECMLLGYADFEDAWKKVTLGETSIVKGVDKNTPPAFLFLNQGDGIVPPHHALQFADKMWSLGIPFEMHVFVTGDHGLGLANKTAKIVDEDFAQWLPLSLRFIQNIQEKKFAQGAKPVSEGYSIDTKLGDILKKPEAVAVFDKYLPGLIQNANSNPVGGLLTFRKALSFLPAGQIPQSVVEKIDAELKAIKH